MSAGAVAVRFLRLCLDKRPGKHHKERSSMAPPSTSKFSFSFSKFPEGGLILAIIVLGLLLAVFGGSVSRPKFQYNAQGKQERVFETGPNGQKVPGFETVNKFFNPQTLIQIAKDTS